MSYSAPPPKNPLATLVVLALAYWLIGGGGIGLPLVTPPPFTAERLCVLVIEETEDRGSYSPGQREALEALQGPGSIRAYVREQNGEYLLLDKDNVPNQHSPKWVAEAWKSANLEQLPWIVAATPRTGFSRPLPKEAADTLAALRKIGG